MTDAVLRKQRVSRFELESGVVLRDLEQAYVLEGALNDARDNLVVVFHSLTGSADVRSWWPQAVGSGLAIDTDRYAVLCPNLLGSCYGTTSPALAAGGVSGTQVTPRDMARLARLLVDELGVSKVALATGGSLGGMVTLEWAATFPELSRAAVAFAAPAAHTAQAIGWNHVQRRAIEMGGEAGLALARMAAMLTYRTAGEFDERFGRRTREDGLFQVRSYLEYQGDKLVRRFDRDSYLTLLDAMDAHDVGRGRGGAAAALGAFAGRLFAVGIPGDLLYTDAQVSAWARAVDAEYREIISAHGHDAFLLDSSQAGAILKEALVCTGASSATRVA